MVARRAIRRLDVLEWAIFVVAALLAAGGGALFALLLEGAGLPFRATWIGSSVLLFAISGLIAIIKVREEERRDGLPSEGTGNGHDG